MFANSEVSCTICSVFNVGIGSLPLTVWCQFYMNLTHIEGIQDKFFLSLAVVYHYS